MQNFCRPNLLFKIQSVFVVWLLTLLEVNAQNPDRLKQQLERIQAVKAIENKALKTGDTAMLANAYYEYGIVYSFAGDEVTSIQYYMKALKLLEPRGDSFDLGLTYMRLGGKAALDRMSYSKKSLAVFRRMKSDKGLLYAYKAMGGAFANSVPPHKNHQLCDSSLYYYQQVVNLARKTHDTLQLADANLFIGMNYIEHFSRKGIPYLQLALKIFSNGTSTDNEFGTMHSLLHLARGYIFLKEPEKALPLLKQAEKFYQEKDLNEFLVQLFILEQYRSYYESIGDWQSAYKYLLLEYDHNRENFMNEKSAAMARMRIEYDSREKEAELAAKNKEIQIRNENLRTQQYLIAATLFLLCVSLVAVYIFFRLNAKNKRISLRNEQLVREQNHRVKNNLQVVSSLLSMQARLLSNADSRKAVEESHLRVQSMALIQRRLYDGNDLVSINVADLVPELTEEVLSAFGYPKTAIRFNVDNISLDTDKNICFALIITELLTNACKYALPFAEKASLSISCKKIEKEIEFTLSDNGPGLPAEFTAADQPEKKGTSRKNFGMYLISLQVRQLNGSFEFLSQNGTVFKMRFPAAR